MCSLFKKINKNCCSYSATSSRKLEDICSHLEEGWQRNLKLSSLLSSSKLESDREIMCFIVCENKENTENLEQCIAVAWLPMYTEKKYLKMNKFLATLWSKLLIEDFKTISESATSCYIYSIQMLSMYKLFLCKTLNTTGKPRIGKTNTFPKWLNVED